MNEQNNNIVNTNEVNENGNIQNQTTINTDAIINEPPCASGEKEVISTIKPTKKPNFIPTLILIIVLLVGVSQIDKIMGLFNEKDTPVVNNNSNNKDDEENHNLVDGFIVLNDNNSYIKIHKIKFYNFVSSKNKITLNYLSDVAHNETVEFGIYIELFNSNKDLLYRELFEEKDISIDSIKTYTVNINEELIPDIKYAKVRKIEESELKKNHSLICRYKETGQGYNLIYKNTFNFIGNQLHDYEVKKELNIVMESTISNKYKADLLEENNSMKTYNILTEYNENSLLYNVDLTKDLSEFTPLYNYKTMSAIVKNNEILKKWECE